MAGEIKISVTSNETTAQLQGDSTEQGWLPPRMTEAQRDAIGSPATGLLIFNSDTGAYNYYGGSSWIAMVGGVDSLTVAVSDETTDLTTGTAKLTFRFPFAFTLSEVRASVKTAPTDAALEVDINEGGSTILSTILSIDSGEKTSTTAATPAVINDADIADDAEITIDIDQVGSTVAGAGLKVTFKGVQA